MDDIDAYAFAPEDFRKLEQVKRRLYDDRPLSPDQRRDLANAMDAILGMAIVIKDWHHESDDCREPRLLEGPGAIPLSQMTYEEMRKIYTRASECEGKAPIKGQNPLGVSKPLSI